MAKGSQNDRKTDAKISVVSYFYIKGENAPYYLFYNRKPSFGPCKIDEIAIRIHSKIHAERNNKLYEKVTPNRTPKSTKNMNKNKKCVKKRMSKINVKKH